MINKARMAMEAIKRSPLAGLIGKNFTKAGLRGPGSGREIAMSVAPDILFGGMSAAMTPGDLGDKAIAGVTDAVLGAGMTAGARGALGLRPGGMGTMALEMGGGMAAGMAAMPVSDALMRIKGGGMSPYDRLQQEQYSAMRGEIEREVLNQLMAGRRTPVLGDPFLTENGLG